ncbi:phage antirepressor KilAC domain-containing protein [Megamonas funiformis]|uniref:phage antirepressor KilAC domain-containing protein n=1 Tax=Megamonas funiformis TaxID=437897 RepID=UPI00294354BB|nr:phage antirepressor KilAC domain-containing protein [Megamonas funiformis]
MKIKVNENGEPTISGRMLYDFLEVKEKYTQWFNRKSKGFIENVDFVPYSEKTESGGVSGVKVILNHVLTLDMAKHLAMMQQNEKGMIARQYFIDIGKKWNSPEMVMSRALTIANKNLLMKDEQILKLTTENQIMKPKADYFDELVDRNTLTNFRDTAKMLHIGQKYFINWLLERKFVYRNIKGKLQPYSQFIANDSNGKGYFEVKEQKAKDDSWSGIQTLITPRGREAFRLLLSQQLIAG